MPYAAEGLCRWFRSDQHFVGDRFGDEADGEERAEGGVTDAAAVESEDELVEIALEMFPSQAVVDAERPSLQVGEDAMDPRQHDMGSHVADDMGIVSDVGRAWIGCPSIGFDGCALSQVGGDKTVQRGGGKVLDCCEANAAGRAVGDFDRAGDEHFALGRATAATRDRIVLGAQGDFCLVELGDSSFTSRGADNPLFWSRRVAA